MEPIEVTKGVGTQPLGPMAQLKQANTDVTEGLHSKAACIRDMLQKAGISSLQVTWQVQELSSSCV